MKYPIVRIDAGQLYGQRGLILGPAAAHNFWRIVHPPTGRILELHESQFERIGGGL